MSFKEIQKEKTAQIEQILKAYLPRVRSEFRHILRGIIICGIRSSWQCRICLLYTSTTEVLGKPVHSDEKNEKMTYVVWKGLDVAKQEVEHLSRKAISDLRALNPTDDYLEILLESLIYREK